MSKLNFHCGAVIYEACYLNHIFDRTDTPEGKLGTEMHNQACELAHEIGRNYIGKKNFFDKEYCQYIQDQFNGTDHTNGMIEGLPAIHEAIIKKVEMMRRNNASDKEISQTMVTMANDLIPSMYFDPETRAFIDPNPQPANRGGLVSRLFRRLHR